MADPKTITCSVDELATGFKVQSGVDQKVLAQRGGKPGDLRVLLVDTARCRPAGGQEWSLHLGNSMLHTGKTGTDGLIEVDDLPIDTYELQVATIVAPVAPRDKGHHVAQSVFLAPVGPGAIPAKVPATCLPGHVLGGRAWFANLADGTTQKEISTKGGKPLKGVVDVVQSVPLGDPHNKDEVKAIVSNPGCEDRDSLALDQFLAGNMPTYCRLFLPIAVPDAAGNVATVRVMADFLAIGTDDDHVRYPLGAWAAQILADEWGCFLPTAKIILACRARARVPTTGKFRPHEGHPMEANNTNHQMSNDAILWHENIIQHGCNPDRWPSDIKKPRIPWNLKTHAKAHGDDRCHLPYAGTGHQHPFEMLCGHKKEVMITSVQCTKAGRADTNGQPGGPLSFLGLWKPDGHPWENTPRSHHNGNYGDYSHGIRLVHPWVTLTMKNGVTRDLHYFELLQDKSIRHIISDSPIDPEWDRPGYLVPPRPWPSGH